MGVWLRAWSNADFFPCSAWLAAVASAFMARPADGDTYPHWRLNRDTHILTQLHAICIQFGFLVDPATPCAGYTKPSSKPLALKLDPLYSLAAVKALLP